MTTAQRHDALAAANRVRRENEALRANIAAGDRRYGVARAVEVIEGYGSPMRFDQLIEAIDRVGPRVAEQMLEFAGIHPAAKVSDPRVTGRQRASLAGQLHEFARPKNRKDARSDR